MATLRDAESGQAIEIFDCQLLAGRTSLFCFFTRTSRDVVLGLRYRLEHDGDEFLVVPFEGHQHEPGRIQILAQVVVRFREPAR